MQTKSLGSDSVAGKLSTVKVATAFDLAFIKALADVHRHEVGFIKQATLEVALAHQEILCTPQGFLHFHHRRDRISTLYHICVSPHYRRQGVGSLLLSAWEENSRNSGITTLRLKCPLDLPANGFYYRMGFSRVSIDPGKKRSLVVWEKKLLSAPPQIPQFVAPLSAGGSELKRLLQLWKLGGDLRNPFAHVIYSPIACPPSTTEYLQQQKERKDTGNFQTVWLDCGAYQVQQGKRTYDDLLAFLEKCYREINWADGYVLPDIVPISSDSDEDVEYKVRDTLFHCERFFSRMPSYVQERALAPVHGRNVSQINRCIETYAKMGITRIGFGSWGTSGPNGSVNMLSQSSLTLFKHVYNIACEHGMSVHCFGIGGPNSYNRLRNHKLMPHSLDSTTWWKAGAFGSIFFPNTAQIQVTVKRGIETTKAGLEKLKQETQHSCYFCENIDDLRNMRDNRIMHNMSAWLDTLGR